MMPETTRAGSSSWLPLQDWNTWCQCSPYFPLGQECQPNVKSPYFLCDRIIMLISNPAIAIRPEEMKHYFNLAKPLALLYTPALTEKIEAVKALCAEDNTGSNSKFPFVEIHITYPESSATHTYKSDPSIGSRSEQIGTLFFTSGTSGKPKGVVHSYSALLASARERIETWKLTENDVVLNQKPGNWMGGIFGILPSLISGACL